MKSSLLTEIEKKMNDNGFLLEIDISGKVTNWSLLAESIFGYKQNDILYSYLPLIPEKIFTDFVEAKNALLKKNGAISIETQRMLEDGTLVELTLSSFTKKLSGKEGKTCVCFKLDKIKEFKKFQSVLKPPIKPKKKSSKKKALSKKDTANQTNNRYEEIVAYFPESFLIIDLSGTIIYANRYSKSLTGYDPSALKGKHLSFLTSKDAEEFKKDFPFIQKKEVGLPVKVKLNTRTGDLIPVEIRSSIVHSESAEVEGFAIMLKDISVQQQRDELIDYLRNYIESTIESLDDAVVTANSDNFIIYWNKGAENIFGYSSAEAIGKSIFIILPEKRNGHDITDIMYKGKSMNLLRKRLSENDDAPLQSVEEELVNKKGITFPALVSLSVPRDKNRNPIIGNVLLIKDITQRKKLEEQLVHSEKLASLGSMISGITHELNNKLAPILGYAQIIKEMNVNSDLSEMISKIELSAKGARNIIHSLLGFARHNKPQFKQINIHEIIIRVVNLFKYKMDVRNIKLKSELHDNIPDTMADETQIEQVLLNIINNSFQSLTGIEGEITVKSSRINNSIVVSISDNGPGIPEENLKRIFDPFFTTKEPSIGTGLGLSVCYGIINNHKGSIHVESKPFEKTSFIIKLPLVKIPKLTKNNEFSEENHFNTANQKRILVIDDDTMIRELMLSILKKNHYVDSADNGGMAFDKIKNDSYDLIISDLRMPGIDGFTLYQMLKEKQSGVEKKLIFTTGDTYDPKTKKFIEETKSTCLPKPFNVLDLTETVNNFFKKTESNYMA